MVVPIVYDDPGQLSEELRQQLLTLLQQTLAKKSSQGGQTYLRDGLRQLSSTYGHIPQDIMVKLYREVAGINGFPSLSTQTLEKIRLKPMRSQSGIQSVAVLTKPFPCPGLCIFCPNDIRMPKSYIASEPGAQRAERNSFDPYLQTYNRLQALHNIGHQPSKIEIIILGGTWSYYPESYQIWFVKECFRALNDFGSGKDDRNRLQQEIEKTIKSAHREANRLIDAESIAIDGSHLDRSYNQVVSQHYLAPEQLQEKSAVPLREQATWAELEEEQQRNETARCRCVGLTIETRPDNISVEEVRRVRRLGATKTQIGFQSLSDAVLEKNKRGHDTAATRRAVQLLRQAGFKIHAHWMPNLYGSNVENDLQEYHQLFHDVAYKPDELKIYPCALIPSAELMAYYERGEWQPYSEEELQTILRYALSHTPQWARLTRVIRDIPSTEVAAGNIKTNHRQIIEDQLRQEGIRLQDIRAREIKRQQPVEPIVLTMTSYETSSSTEHFLQFVDGENHILGFVRLSLPTMPSPVEELGRNALIRELHVYGITESVGTKETGSPQHSGFGKKLLAAAEKVAQEAGYLNISVISAVGTREYYRQRGYQDGELYQSKAL